MHRITFTVTMNEDMSVGVFSFTGTGFKGATNVSYSSKLTVNLLTDGKRKVFHEAEVVGNKFYDEVVEQAPDVAAEDAWEEDRGEAEQ